MRGGIFPSQLELSLFALPLVFRAELSFERIEAFFPEAFCFREPGLDFAKASRIERVNPPLALSADGDQPRLAQHFQMLRNRRSSHVESLDDLSCRSITHREHLHDAPARGIGKSSETEHGDSYKGIA